jgi:hypothetical protein
MDLLRFFGGHVYVQEWFVAATTSKNCSNRSIDPQHVIGDP